MLCEHGLPPGQKLLTAEGNVWENSRFECSEDHVLPWRPHTHPVPGFGHDVGEIDRQGWRPVIVSKAHDVPGFMYRGVTGQHCGEVRANRHLKEEDAGDLLTCIEELPRRLPGRVATNTMPGQEERPLPL